MPVLETLMKRLGFVKLADYGLVLTPEGRVISIRPAVLGDHSGRIVGYRDDDIAALELAPWEQPRPAAPPAVAPRVATPPVSARPAIPAPAPVEEDDWAWTIAIARARAAADDVLAARMPAPAAPVRPTTRRLRANTVPPPMTTAPAPQATPVPPAPVPPPARPAAPAPRIMRPLEAPRAPAPPAPRIMRPLEAPRAPARGTPAPAITAAPPAPRKVIQIPTRPALAPVSAAGTSAPAPAPRTRPTPIVPPAPRRLAQGTGPIHPHTVAATRHEDVTVPQLRVEPALPAIPRPPASARPLPSIIRSARG